jgi:hypothetical protein
MSGKVKEIEENGYSKKKQVESKSADESAVNGSC